MKFTICFAFFFITLLSFSQSTENDTQQLKKTKVLSITVMGSTMDEFGNAHPIRSKKEYRKYNTSGLLTQEIIYDANSAIVTNTSFAYTSKGVINKQLKKDNSGKTIKRQVCSFNNKNEKTECNGIEEETEFTINYAYDENGNQIHRKKVLKDGKVIFDCNREFELNQLTKETYLGSPQVTIEYQYDSTGLLLSKNTFSNNQLSYSYSYEYNNKGKLIKESKYDANNVLIEKLMYNYIDEKLIKSISKYNRSGYLTMSWKYIYDEKSNIQKINIYEGENSTPLYQSEYLYKYYN